MSGSNSELGVMPEIPKIIVELQRAITNAYNIKDPAEQYNAINRAIVAAYNQMQYCPLKEKLGELLEVMLTANDTLGNRIGFIPNEIGKIIDSQGYLNDTQNRSTTFLGELSINLMRLVEQLNQQAQTAAKDKIQYDLNDDDYDDETPTSHYEAMQNPNADGSQTMPRDTGVAPTNEDDENYFLDPGLSPYANSDLRNIPSISQPAASLPNPYSIAKPPMNTADGSTSSNTKSNYRGINEAGTIDSVYGPLPDKDKLPNPPHPRPTSTDASGNPNAFSPSSTSVGGSAGIIPVDRSTGVGSTPENAPSNYAGGQYKDASTSSKPGPYMSNPYMAAPPKIMSAPEEDELFIQPEAALNAKPISADKVTNEELTILSELNTELASALGRTTPSERDAAIITAFTKACSSANLNSEGDLQLALTRLQDNITTALKPPLSQSKIDAALKNINHFNKNTLSPLIEYITDTHKVSPQYLKELGANLSKVATLLETSLATLAPPPVPRYGAASTTSVQNPYGLPPEELRHHEEAINHLSLFSHDQRDRIKNMIKQGEESPIIKSLLAHIEEAKTKEEFAEIKKRYVEPLVKNIKTLQPTLSKTLQENADIILKKLDEKCNKKEAHFENDTFSIDSIEKPQFKDTYNEAADLALELIGQKKPGASPASGPIASTSTDINYTFQLSDLKRETTVLVVPPSATLYGDKTALVQRREGKHCHTDIYTHPDQLKELKALPWKDKAVRNWAIEKVKHHFDYIDNQNRADSNSTATSSTPNIDRNKFVLRCPSDQFSNEMVKAMILAAYRQNPRVEISVVPPRKGITPKDIHDKYQDSFDKATTKSTGILRETTLDSALTNKKKGVAAAPTPRH